MDRAPEEDEHTWTEQIEISGSELVDRTKELISQGNVRRLIIYTSDDEKLMEVPLTAGVVVGGAFTLLAPVLAALGAMAALLARVKIEVVRTGQEDEGLANAQER
ncbi:MAG: DUF4342 domain-containing protein [Rubrobacter sp.]|nr:DUF4342 domain-containing protein [Rubrobacter sp.]